LSDFSLDQDRTIGCIMKYQDEASQDLKF